MSEEFVAEGSVESVESVESAESEKYVESEKEEPHKRASGKNNLDN